MENEMKKCKKCNHIYAPDEQHECPTAAYLAAVGNLVSAAAEYEERNWFNGTNSAGEPIHLEK